MKKYTVSFILDLGDFQLTPNDLRFLFSNWGEDHTNEEIRKNVAAAQNHSQATHQRHYNYVMAARKKKLTLTYIQERAGGEAGELDVEAVPEYDEKTSQEIEELRKKTAQGKNYF